MDPLSIIASVVGILGAIKATYKTIQQIKDLPEAFKEVEKNLPLVHKILRNARNRLEEEKEQGVEISEDECEAVLAVLKHCEISAVTLKQILEELEAKCNKENNENDWKKAREWYRMALQYSKKKRVETLMEEIMSGVEKLVWRETFQLATSENVQSLRDAIKGLSEVEPSIEGFELESLGVINAEQHIAENATGQQNNMQGGINTLYSGKYNISGTSAQVTFELTKVRSLDNRQTIQYRDKNHHVESFMADLFITDPRDDKARIKDAKGGLLNQSCAWLINHETFQDWYQDDSKRLLWLKGDPGKGKTMLMIGLIEELEGRLRAMGDKESCTKPILCYYFFEGTKSERSNATVMLRALMWLLVSQKNSLGKHLVGESGKTISKVISGPNAFTALSNVFQRILKDSNLPAVYILIDALDECNRGLEQVLSFINQSSSHPHVKWIVSGRNEDIIVSSLQPCATTKREAYGIDNYTCRLFLSLEDNEKAVSLQVDDYINQHMADIKVLRANDTLRQNVRDVLRDRSQGTFLWVHLAIKELKNAKDVLSKLENLPTGLGSLYKQIMDHLKGHPDSEDSLKILSTVILTFRPLHVLELWRLCGFPDEAGFDADVIKGFVLFPQGKSICHADIAKASLETMTRVLKENVYDVPDAHGTPQYNLLIKEIPVPATNPLFPVRYLCSHWIAHLLKVDGIVFLRDGGFLHEFMKNCLIYWLEAVGLLGETMIVYQSLQRLEHALRTKTPNSSLQNLVSDINRFVGTFSWVISNAPLQLYVSARVFCPPKSLAYTVLKGQDPEWLISKPAVSDYWPPELATIEDCPGIFSPDGTLIGQIIQHTLYIRDSATAELMAVRDLRKPAEKVFDWIRNGQDSTLAFSFDNRLIAIVARTLDRGLFFGVIDAVFSPTNPIVMLDRPSTIQTLVFSPKGNYLACGCLDGTVQVWSTKSWQVVITYAHRDRVPAIDFSPDDSLIASASWDGTVSVRCTTSGSIVWTFEQRVAVPLLWHWVKRTRVLALAFSSDGKGLLSVSCSADVVRWDIRTGEPTKSSMLAGFDSFANLFALDEFDYGTFSYNGQLVALSCAGSTIVWNTVSAQLQLERKHVGDCSKLPSLSPLGKWLIVAGKIWEITTRPTDNMRAFIPTPMQITKDGLWIVYNYFVCTKSQIGKGNSSLSKGYNMCNFWVMHDGNILAIMDRYTRMSGECDLINVANWNRSRVLCPDHSSLLGLANNGRPTSEPTYRPSHDLHWIKHNGYRVLWLPQDYRPSAELDRSPRHCQSYREKHLSHLRAVVFERGASTFANAAGNALREDVLKNREELAEVYLDRGKSSTLSAEETKRYGDTLLDLVSDSEQTWSNIVPACCLIRFYNFRPLDLPDTAKICIRAIIRDVVELDHEAGAKTKQANEEDGDQMKTDKESTQGNSDESNDSDDYYDSDSDNPTEVERPASLVVCSGCDRDLTLARDILHTCIDCGGRRQFDDHCWNLLARGELNLEDKGLVCRREHSFMVLTMWDEDIAKRWTPEFVPGVDEENILLDDWKRELKQTYGCLSDEAPQFL
ncbi:wd40 repeat protein [Fusarium sp. NRRL 25303]|nr:wd40 repeat protein [Fusarium sp. NRRL 25303]